MPVSYDEILRRIRAVSVSLGPLTVDIDLPAPERDAASRLLTILEDRRVLFVPYESEIPKECVASVQGVRQVLADELLNLDRRSKLFQLVNGMRAACRDFLSNAEPLATQDGLGIGQNVFFYDALGRFRQLIGMHLGNLCVLYKFDLPDHLASILPPPVEHE